MYVVHTYYALKVQIQYWYRCLSYNPSESTIYATSTCFPAFPLPPLLLPFPTAALAAEGETRVAVESSLLFSEGVTSRDLRCRVDSMRGVLLLLLATLSSELPLLLFHSLSLPLSLTAADGCLVSKSASEISGVILEGDSTSSMMSSGEGDFPLASRPFSLELDG